MDINPLRLEKITACVNKINAAFGNKATVTSTMNRAEALEGADGVVCTVFNGDIDIWRYDIEIPKEYGVDINDYIDFKAYARTIVGVTPQTE